MSDGATEMIRDEALKEEATKALQMFRCGGVVIFIHKAVVLDDFYNGIRILKTGATEWSTKSK